MNITEAGNLMTVAYDSLADMMAAEVHPKNAKDAETHPTCADNSRLREVSFYGLEDELGNGKAPCGAIYSKVLEYVTSGWPKGREVMAKLQAGLPQIDGVKSIRKRRIFSDHGDELRPDALYSGRLDTAWVSSKRDRYALGGSNAITLHVMYSDNCQVTAEQLMYNGLAAVALADKLIEAGYQVEIIGAVLVDGLYPGKKDAKLSLFTVPLKSFGEHLDCDRLASVIGLAGFFRSQTFKAFMSLPYKTGRGLGRAANYSAQNLLGSDATIIAGLYSQEKAVEFLNGKIAALNGAQQAA